MKSKTLEMINFEKLPAGQNAQVAVMSYSGYDIEDAVILNRASLDRGFARASTLRKKQANLEQYKSNNYEIARDRVIPPPSAKPDKFGRIDPEFKKYHALGPDGLANIGQKGLPSSHMGLAKSSLLYIPY